MPTSTGSMPTHLECTFPGEKFPADKLINVSPVGKALDPYVASPFFRRFKYRLIATYLRPKVSPAANYVIRDQFKFAGNPAS